MWCDCFTLIVTLMSWETYWFVKSTITLTRWSCNWKHFILFSICSQIFNKIIMYLISNHWDFILMNESNWGSILRYFILFFLWKKLNFWSSRCGNWEFGPHPNNIFFFQKQIPFSKLNLVATWIGVSTRTNNKSTLITILWQLDKFFSIKKIFDY